MQTTSEPHQRSDGARASELAAVAVAVTVFAGYVLVRYLPRGRLGWGFDRLAYTAPNHAAAFESLRALRLPEWNPYVFGGAPLLANPQVGAFYPLKYPFMWVQPQRGVTILLGLHLVIFGLGMLFLLGRVLRLQWPAVLIGSLAAVASGVVISQLPHYEQLATIALAPSLLSAVDLAIQRRLRAPVGIGVIAVVVALMLLCGHQQPAYYVLLLVGAWTGGRILDRREFASIVVVPLGIVAGFGLAAIQLLPTLRLVGRSVRADGLELAAVDVPEYILTPTELLVTVLGDPFSRSTPVGSEVYASVGVATLFFALCGLIAGAASRKHRWHTVALGAASAVGVVLAMGTETPVYGVAFRYLPALDLFRVPGRSIVILDLAAPVLAALGVEAILRSRHRAVTLRSSLALAALVTMAILLPQSLPNGRAVLLWGLVGGAVVGAALIWTSSGFGGRGLSGVVLVVVPLVELVLAGSQPAPVGELPGTEATGKLAPYLRSAGGRVVSAGIDDIGNQAYLRVSLRPNVNATEGVRSLDGYDGGAVLTTRWTEAMEAISGQKFNPDLTMKSQLGGPIAPDTAARFGVRWFLVDVRNGEPASLLPGWIGPVEEDGPLQLFQNPAYLGEARVYRSAVIDDGRPLNEQLATMEDPVSTAIVESGRRLACAGACQPMQVPLTRIRPEQLVVRLGATHDTGVLVVSEGWDSGWSAVVDGTRRTLRPADRNSLALDVRADDREVVLTYRAPGLRLGAAISGAVAGALTLACSTSSIRRRWRRTGCRADDAELTIPAPLSPRSGTSTGPSMVRLRTEPADQNGNQEERSS